MGLQVMFENRQLQISEELPDTALATSIPSKNHMIVTDWFSSARSRVENASLR